jgi:type II secretory pathway component GspD/PulD (secretin)
MTWRRPMPAALLHGTEDSFMSARLLPAYLAAALLAAPAFAQPPARQVTATYQVADLVIPVDGKPRVINFPHGQAIAEPVQKTACSEKPATTEDQLISLITSTVAPQSWQSMGGSGTIEYFPLGMALVLKQTPAVQEQVAELLAALRRLQDEEVAVEIRFISVSDNLMQRLATLSPANTGSGTDSPAAPHVTFLDDKQLVQLMEGVQGDMRSNVMQSPKVTMMNGQSSVIRVMEKKYFVTGLTTTHDADGNIVFIPKNEAHDIGLETTVQPAISADRRHVQLHLKVNQATLSDVVPLFPVTTYIKPVKADGTKGEPVPFTQYIQQPQIDKHSVDVTLAIPEGHTALLDGWQQTHESRTECDSTPGVLSKVPYVNRLFKNVGYGRETEHVFVLVTPRIVINQETEERLTARPCPKATGTAEESEPPVAETSRHKVARLLVEYHQRCADGRLAEARKLANEALKLDPTCFDK